MRKLLIVAGSVIGIIILAIIALFVYAYFNLNRLIASNRGYILTRASDALGRSVAAQDIKATVGWGVNMDVTDVKVADDPSFSQLPFLQAAYIHVNVALLPLLSRSLKLTSLVIKQPAVRVIRNRTGVLNISTLGKPSAGKAGNVQPKPPPATSTNTTALAALTVKALKIQNGNLWYQDQQAGGPPIRINNFNLSVDNFSVSSPFDVAMSLAALSQQQDFVMSGTIGPLMHGGVLNTKSVPLNLAATIGPISLAQLKALPQLRQAIPADLTIARPFNVNSKITGTTGVPVVNATADLTSNQVSYDRMLDKPAGVPLSFSGSASTSGSTTKISNATLVLASLEAKLSNVVLQSNALAARVVTNTFNLGPLGKVLTPAQKYDLSGTAQMQADLHLANHQPSINGALTLTRVNANLPGITPPPLSDLSGTIRMAGNTAEVGPLNFNLGSKPAHLQAAAQSLQPLRAHYQFNAVALKVGDLVPSRSQLGEVLNQLAATGDLSRSATGQIGATTQLTSVSGMVANVPYQHLALAAGLQQDQLRIQSLKLNAFDGAIDASGVADIAGDRNFNLKLNTAHLNVQKALAAQKSKAAGTLSGILNGNVQVTGAGSSFDQIKPTLHGGGGANLSNGKLVGINVVAEALQKADNLPMIGSLVPASVVARHPELFRSNDTDIQQAKLTFALQGPRVSTHDLDVAAADYSVLGDGWFDMDKHVNLAARILMSRGFSQELVAAKRQISYLANPDGRVEIPLRIVGQLPRPAVLPDVSILAQRAASHAMENKFGGLLRKKAGPLGGFLGGGNHGSTPPVTNPLNQLKGLFH